MKKKFFLRLFSLCNPVNKANNPVNNPLKISEISINTGISETEQGEQGEQPYFIRESKILEKF